MEAIKHVLPYAPVWRLKNVTCCATGSSMEAMVLVWYIGMVAKPSTQHFYKIKST